MVAPAWCLPFTKLEYSDKGRGPSAFDCWGFVRHVLGQHFGVTNLPDFSAEYSSAEDQAEVARTVCAGIDSLTATWKRVINPQPGDIVILRLAGHPWHCGLVVGGDWMMHMLKDVNVALERFTGPVWRNRVEGFYRHV